MRFPFSSDLRFDTRRMRRCNSDWSMTKRSCFIMLITTGARNSASTGRRASARLNDSDAITLVAMDAILAVECLVVRQFFQSTLGNVRGKEELVAAAFHAKANIRYFLNRYQSVAIPIHDVEKHIRRAQRDAPLASLILLAVSVSLPVQFVLLDDPHSPMPVQCVSGHFFDAVAERLYCCLSLRFTHPGR